MQNRLNSRHLLCLFPSFHYHNRTNAFDFFLPSRALQSETNSAEFMKKLVTVALSNIFKYRGVFPEDSFVKYENVDFDVNVLDTSKITCRRFTSQASYFVKRLIGLFDAIDRKYVKELHVRLISQGTGKGLDDGIELFTFHFAYGSTPLITLTFNGEPACLAKLGQASSILMASVDTLLENIEKMATSLPPLSRGSNPHLTIWMKKTDDAPAEWIAPGYPPGPLYGPVDYPPMDRVMYDGLCTSNDVTTGFHTLTLNYKFAEGNFADSELFQRYYGNKRRGRSRVIELSSDETFENESYGSRSEQLDESSEDCDSFYRYQCNNRFESLSALDSDEESERNSGRREYDEESDTD